MYPMHEIIIVGLHRGCNISVDDCILNNKEFMVSVL